MPGFAFVVEESGNQDIAPRPAPMKRSRMPDMELNNRVPVQLLPIVMPAPSSPSLGEWRNHGLCIDKDPNVFFPFDGNPGRQARQICAGCTVGDDCLGYAINADEFGIWAA